MRHVVHCRNSKGGRLSSWQVYYARRFLSEHLVRSVIYIKGTFSENLTLNSTWTTTGLCPLTVNIIFESSLWIQRGSPGNRKCTLHSVRTHATAHRNERVTPSSDYSQRVFTFITLGHLSVYFKLPLSSFQLSSFLNIFLPHQSFFLVVFIPLLL